MGSVKIPVETQKENAHEIRTRLERYYIYMFAYSDSPILFHNTQLQDMINHHIDVDYIVAQINRIRTQRRQEEYEKKNN